MMDRIIVGVFIVERRGFPPVGPPGRSASVTAAVMWGTRSPSMHASMKMKEIATDGKAFHARGLLFTGIDVVKFMPFALCVGCNDVYVCICIKYTCIYTYIIYIYKYVYIESERQTDRQTDEDTDRKRESERER